MLKKTLLVFFIVIPVMLYSQQERLRFVNEIYQPLLASLQQLDSVFIYADCFIAFKRNDTVAGYFINRNLAFHVLAGRNLIEPDSFNLITRTVIDTSIYCGEIVQFISQKGILGLPEEKELILQCNQPKTEDGYVFYYNPAFLIDDGSYFTLTEIAGIL